MTTLPMKMKAGVKPRDAKPFQQMLTELEAFAQRCADSALAPAKALPWGEIIGVILPLVMKKCFPQTLSDAVETITGNARLLRAAKKEKCPKDVAKALAGIGVKSKADQEAAFFTLMAQAAAEKDDAADLLVKVCNAVETGDLVIEE